MALLGWIDFSVEDRNRIGSVLDLLRPEGMVDELGIGTIRDAIAKQLFPGISTIQTRAKYFFIIPYILYDYQFAKPQHRKGKTPLKFLEDQEYEVMWALAEKYNYEEGKGVIGISKRKPDKIVRRPSAIYWNGLYTYRFIDTKGLGAAAFLEQSSPGIASLLSSTQQGDDAFGDDPDAEYENKFSIKVPFLTNWQQNLTLDLEKKEADFFRDRIMSIAKNKLIAALLQHHHLWEIFAVADSLRNFVQAAIHSPIEDELKKVLVIAHDFSHLMYGAHIAYNCLLQQKVFNNNCFKEDWQRWMETVQKNMLDYENFNPDAVLSYSMTTRNTTRQFIRDWWQQVQLGFINPEAKDTLILQQEAIVKAGKARLKWNKTDDVKENVWTGLRHLEYRFTQARNILKDIKDGTDQ